MRKLLLALILSVSLPAMADAANQHHRHRDSLWWLGPAVVGGIVTYSLTRPYYPPPPPPVYYTPPRPGYYYPDLPPAPYGYHYQMIMDQMCACNRIVLVPN